MKNRAISELFIIQGNSTKFILPFFISVAMCVIFMNLAQQLAPKCEDNEWFFSLTGSWDSYCSGSMKEWKARLLSNYLAKWFALLGKAIATTEGGALKATIGIWAFCWLFAINTLYILLARKACLYYIFGTFASLAFAYVPFGSNVWFYPWDLPNLFMFTLCVLCLRNSHFEPLRIIIPLGIFFRETIIVLSFSFLFMPLPRKTRIKYWGIALALCIAVRCMIDLIVKNPVPIFSMRLGNPQQLYLWNNIWCWFHMYLPSFHHPIFINSGTLLCLLLLPHLDWRVYLLKGVALIFLINIFLLGRFVEYRSFIEIIPLALWGFEILFSCEHQSTHTT
ncbi:MAG: hypothetical protein P8123_08105 [bacterium]